MPHAVPQVCFASASPVGPSALTHLTDVAVSATRPTLGSKSSIDIAFDSLLTVTQIAVKSAGDWTSQHGLILSASAVAVAEDYFRSILAEVVELCALCEQRVQPLQTRMEFVFSGSVADAVRGMLDGESFSSKENVAKWTEKVAGLKVKTERSLDLALTEFERICHIRHAATHAGGYVSTKNALALGVPAGTWISFASPAAIHEIVSVVTACIRAYNQILFEDLIGGWIREMILEGNWSEDRAKFASLWLAFRSEGDIQSSKATGVQLRANPYAAYLAVRGAFVARAAASAE